MTTPRYAITWSIFTMPSDKPLTISAAWCRWQVFSWSSLAIVENGLGVRVLLMTERKGWTAVAYAWNSDTLVLLGWFDTRQPRALLIRRPAIDITGGWTEETLT